MRKYLAIGAAIVAIAAILVILLVWYPFIQQYRVNAHLSNAKAYQQVGQWEQMERELRKAIALHPESEEAWQLLAWNYCYNVSEEFDLADDKYAAIRRGIEIAIKAAGKNPRSAQLHWAVGWNFFHRIGKAPETAEFRRLFAADHELHSSLRDYVAVDAALGSAGKPDNFLIAKLWFSKASEVADRFGLNKDWMGPTALHAYAAHSQTNYALAIESEGAPRDIVVPAWQDAAVAWHEYGNREFNYAEGRSVRFNDFHELLVLRDELEEQKNSGHGNPEQISRKLDEVSEKLYWTDRLRTMINFGYWPERCRLEQTEPWLAARRMMYEARQAAVSAKSSPGAKVAAGELFENAFAAWERILKDNPGPQDDVLLDELAEHARFYRSTLLDGGPLPGVFPLHDLIEQVEAAAAQQQAALQSVMKSSTRGHPAGRRHGAR